MAVTTWLLLCLLIVSLHTITGEGTYNHDVRDDRNTLQSLSEDWEPKIRARK